MREKNSNSKNNLQDRITTTNRRRRRRLGRQDVAKDGQKVAEG